MKPLNLSELTRIHRSLLGLAVLGAAFLLTTQPARRFVRQHAAAAAMLPQAQVGPPPQLVAQPAPAKACSPNRTAEVLAEVLAPATKESPSVRIDCSLTLARSHVITKRLIFEGAEASGVTVECNGATIDGKRFLLGYDRLNDKSGFMPGFAVEIKSKPITPDPATGLARFEPPQNVTLRNCKIIGPVKVYGSAGEGVEVARRSDYVQRMRNHAPRNIVFDQVTIEGLGGEGAVLYLFSGVSHFQLLNSEIKGSTSDVNIYLDAESYGNTFRNNRIHATPVGHNRELIAIDGSSYNTIVNNYFSALNHGGIYLYRNCGEKGLIRHSTPSGNTIVNNFFYYDKYEGDNPAIFVGERNGRSSKSYNCDADEKYPGCCQYGSSVSQLDHALFNGVMQNQIRKRSVSDMIRVNRPNDINTPNYIEYNQTVEAEIERKAGCYISDGYPYFILDGQFVNHFRGANGEPVCRGYRLTCNDGVLTRSSDFKCQVSQVGSVDFECQATGNNQGCQKTVFVPAGKKIIGAKAACNLEFGTVSAADLNGVPANSVKVLRASDTVLNGGCTLGSTSISSGQAAVSGIIGQNRVSIGCRERDSNGGDCHIKGRLYYR
jgi:hypothetical protein